MATKKIKVGKEVIVKEESGSKYTGEVVRVESQKNGFANLSQNNELIVLNMSVKYLR